MKQKEIHDALVGKTVDRLSTNFTPSGREVDSMTLVLNDGTTVTIEINNTAYSPIEPGHDFLEIGISR